MAKIDDALFFEIRDLLLSVADGHGCAGPARILLRKLSSHPLSCEFWDCGWCYHPSTDATHGCPGFHACPIKEKHAEEA